MLIAYSYNISLKKILKWVEKIKEPPGRLEKITLEKEYTISLLITLILLKH